MFGERSDKASAAKDVADAIEGSKQQILSNGSLNGEIRVFNRQGHIGKEQRKQLWEMVRWEYMRIPDIIFKSPFKDLKNGELKPKRLLLPGAILIALLLALVVWSCFLIYGWHYIQQIWALGTGFVWTTLMVVWAISPVLAVIVICNLVVLLVLKLPIFVKMAMRKNVVLHYISWGDKIKRYDKNGQELKDANGQPVYDSVPNGAEYFLIITVNGTHDVVIDDFTAKIVRTHGTRTMGNLLAAIFSQTPQGSTETKVTYHVHSPNLDEKYRTEFDRHFPGIKPQVNKANRVINIPTEVLGL